MKAATSGGGFFTGVLKLTGKFSGLTDTISGATSKFSALGPVLGTVTGLFAAEAAAVMALGAEYRALDREAKNLGTTIEGLNRLSYIGEKGGSSKEGMQNSVVRMQANIGEALQQPTGEAAKGLANLGLDPKKLGTEDAEQQFYQVAGAIANLGTHAERVAVTMQIFGKESKDMIAQIEKGESSLRAWAASATPWGSWPKRTSRPWSGPPRAGPTPRRRWPSRRPATRPWWRIIGSGPRTA